MYPVSKGYRVSNWHYQLVIGVQMVGKLIPNIPVNYRIYHKITRDYTRNFYLNYGIFSTLKMAVSNLHTRYATRLPGNQEDTITIQGYTVSKGYTVSNYQSWLPGILLVCYSTGNFTGECRRNGGQRDRTNIKNEKKNCRK